MKLKEFIRQNPRKILENLTSYLAIIIGLLGILTAYGLEMGLTPENIAKIVTATIILNRVLTYIRVNYLKEQIPDPETTYEDGEDA